MKARTAGLLFAALAFSGFGTGALAHEEETAVQGPPPAEVSVGGFDVRGTTIPMATVEREAARDYLDRVRPIFEDSARDLSRVVEPEVRSDNGELTLDIGVESIESAREAAEEGLQRLQKVEPPEGLKEVQQESIGAHEDAVSAYDDLIAAYESGDADRLDAAVRDDFPRIERFNHVANTVLQDLERAAPPEQGSVEEARQGADRAEQELKQAEEEVRKLTEELEAERDEGLLGGLFGS